MNTETICKRIASISNDVQRLSSTLFALGGIDIPRHFNEYEKLSIEAAQRAEWIALRLRHLIYDGTLIEKRNYMPKAVDVLGIEVREDDGIYELTLPGLMPKRKARQGTEYIIDPLMYALEQFAKTHTIRRFPHTTVCFALVYDWDLPQRRVRDYDNLELKSILDAAAAYLMVSDAGLLCDTYHTTELGRGTACGCSSWTPAAIPSGTRSGKRPKSWAGKRQRRGPIFRVFAVSFWDPAIFSSKGVCRKRSGKFNAQEDLPKFYLTR